MPGEEPSKKTNRKKFRGGEYKRKDQSQKEKQAKAEADKLAAQKKAEAEKAKKEQEQKEKEQREREKQRKEKEGRIQQLQQSIEDSHKKLEDFYKDKQEKREIRNQLLKDASARPTANMLKSLDSGIKRNTALIKKLKQGITEENVEHLCKEIPLLNLTRYVSEVVAAIVDFKPKSSVPAIVRICVLMHARYSEFTDDLIPRLQKLIELPPSFDNDQDKKMFFNRKKEILKLFTELFLVGILPNDDILFSIISDHVKNAPKGFSDDDVAIYGMILQITWARLVCNEFMGISPPAFYQILQHQQQLYEMQQEAAANNEAEAKNNQSATTSETTDASGTENTTPDNAVESDTQAADAVEQEVNEEQKQVEEAAKRAQEEKQKRVDELTEKVRSLDQTTPLIDESRREEYHNLAIEYFERISKHIVSLHKQLRHTERENTKIINLKGEMTEKRTDAYQKQLKSHDRLLNGLNTLAELLRQEVPQMPEEDETTRISGDIGLADLSRIQAQNEEEGIFGDEDTRSFYEDIRCLRELLPAVFFDSSAKDTATEDAAPEDQPLSTDEADETPEDIVVPDSDEKEINELSETSDSLATLTTEGDPMENPSDEPVVVDSKPEKGNAKLEEFVKELPKCVNRELIDDAAMNFCYIATKGNRKRLPRCLFNVPRQQLELLPYYSRLTATLHPVYPEISEKLIVLLQSEFGYLVNKKDQTNIETKIRNVRFIGELTKFKICKPSIALRCLQICLQNFSHHNIDMACNLLEACGRFLYRTPETHVRTSNFLDTMMRLKNAKNFDPRMETLIDNAFYYCKPPERVAFQKERTPIQLYIRHLIFHKLSKDTIKEVLRKLCRLSWKDHGNYLVKCLLNLKNISYSNIPYVANLVASFQNYNPDVGVKVVDACLYEFYDGLSKNIVTHQQHRVMNIKLLGELYAFCVIDTALIFNILYTLITSPCGENESFRIRLVCVLLSVCSPYFGSAADKRKFSRFLVYFQCYYFSLDFIPYDVEFMMADTLGSLPKQFKRLKTPEEAQKALYNVRQANELRKIVPFSLDRLQISFEGSADDIEEDVNDLESSDPAQKESSKPAERKHKKTRKPEKPEEGEEKEETNEEDEFDQLFDSIVRESLSTRKSDNIPNNGLTMAVPMNLFRSSNAISKAPKTAEQEKPTTTFRLLMKKGNKQTTYNLEIPSESPFANRKHDDEWEEEQRAIKRKVLEYEAQEAEEEILNAGGDAIPYDIGRFRDPTKMKPKNKNVYWSNQ